MSVENNSTHILLVAANESDFRTFARMTIQLCHEGFSEEGSYQVTSAKTLAKAMKLILSRHFDVILLDAHLPDACGAEGIIALRNVSPETPVIVLGGARHLQLEREALNAGAQDWLVKRELNPELLLRSLSHAMARSKALAGISSRLEAQETSRDMQDAFLLTMQHQLCRPLTTIVGFTEMLLSEKLPLSSKRAMIETIQRNSNHLLRLIKSSADLSQLKSGMLPVELVQSQTLPVLAEVDRKMRAKARDRGLSLRIIHTTPIPELILTDPDRLQQVLFYLLLTAIELASKDLITMSISCDRETCQLSFEISYQGRGLNTRDNSSLLRSEFQEVGLELLIAEELAERLGGSLKVQAGKEGSQILRVSIDTGGLESVKMIGEDPALARGEISAEYPSFRGRVLVTEDCPDTQQLLSYLLGRCGLNITLVQSGRDAIKQAKGSEFDLVILSSQLPVLDGHSVAMMLRSQGYRGPLVAFGGALKNQQTQVYTDYLRKPFTKQQLFTLLGRYLKVATEKPDTTVLDALDLDVAKYTM